MSTDNVKARGKLLYEKADERLDENERRYGSADDYVAGKDLAGHLDYCEQRIAEYLRCLKANKGADPKVLLADAVNQLRFVFAKYEELTHKPVMSRTKRQKGKKVPLPERPKPPLQEYWRKPMRKPRGSR